MPAVHARSQMGTVKGHILPFPLLMKCQATAPAFPPLLIHTPFDPPSRVTFQSLWRSFQNLKDVGVVQVKVIRAEGLMAADVTGKTATLRPSTEASAPISLNLIKGW